MPSNQTANYNLSQWEATDPVLRADFNADNAKLETALSDLEARMSMLERSNRNQAYYLSYMGLRDWKASKIRLPQQAMFCHDFSVPAFYQITGGATISNNVLKLTGAGNTATVTTKDILIDDQAWSKAFLWLHCDGLYVNASFNGQPMVKMKENITSLPGGTENHLEFFYSLDRTDNEYSGHLTLDLECSGSSISVYDWFMFFV